MKRLAFLLLWAAPAFGQWTTNGFGFIFRNSDNYTPVPAHTAVVKGCGSYTYPTTTVVDGVSLTYGWENVLGGGTPNCVDRSNSADTRLTGCNYMTPGGAGVFRVDLPSAGAYQIYAAFGDIGGGTYVQNEYLYDGAALLAQIVTNKITDSTKFAATDGNMYATANWVRTGSGVSIQKTFSTTILRIKLGGVAGNWTSVAYMRVLEVLPCHFGTSSLSGATTGAPYRQTLSATGCVAPAFGVASGSLPAGLSLNSSTGTISGTPSGSGTSAPASLQVTSSATVLPSNGLALLPPMGWNTWYNLGSAVTEAQIHTQADLMVSKGLLAAGYSYLNLDATNNQRDGGGHFILNATQFPSGGAALGTYIHSKGLKFGTYSGPGFRACAGSMGSGGHEAADAATWASWGVDFLKSDWCGAGSDYYGLYGNGDDEITEHHFYRLMGASLQASGRNVVYSLCQYGAANVLAWGANAGGNMWRLTNDMGTQWANLGISSLGVDSEFDALAAAWASAGPGHWNDPDMLEIGNGLTVTEGQTQMALWSMGAAPLIAAANLNKIGAADLATLLNSNAIAIDQDALGIAGQRISKVVCGTSFCEVWARPLSGNRWALALFNRDSAAHTVTANWSNITAIYPGFGGAYATTFDIWAKASAGTLDTSYAPTVAPHGSVFVRLSR